MIKEVRYKGQKVDLKDIEVVYTDHWAKSSLETSKTMDDVNGTMLGQNAKQVKVGRYFSKK